jgi:hypothetical protein
VKNGAYLTIVKSVANKPNRWFDIGGSGAPAYTGNFLAGSVTSTSSPFKFTSFSSFTLGNLTGGGNPLPITLLSFNAVPTPQNTVDVNWVTSSQINNKLFTVEKTQDGVSYDSVTSLPGAGNTTEQLSYGIIDETPFAGISYYRLKQTDFDGHFTYSDIVPVNISSATNIIVAPNPTHSNITLSFNSQVEGATLVEFYDGIGRKVSNYNLDAQKGTNTFTMDMSGYAAGIYIIRVIDANGNSKVIKVIKE